MKLSTRILIAFLIIILVPVALTFFLMFGVAMFQGERLLSVYGIDVMNLTNEIKILLIDALFCMICILVITGSSIGVSQQPYQEHGRAWKGSRTKHYRYENDA